jgi:hypothetical protein
LTLSFIYLTLVLLYLRVLFIQIPHNTPHFWLHIIFHSVDLFTHLFTSCIYLFTCFIYTITSHFTFDSVDSFIHLFHSFINVFVCFIYTNTSNFIVDSVDSFIHLVIYFINLFTCFIHLCQSVIHVFNYCIHISVCMFYVIIQTLLTLTSVLIYICLLYIYKLTYLLSTSISGLTWTPSGMNSMRSLKRMMQF